MFCHLENKCMIFLRYSESREACNGDFLHVPIQCMKIVELCFIGVDSSVTSFDVGIQFIFVFL